MAIRTIGTSSTGKLWLVDAACGNRTQLTSAPEDEAQPVWSPDGQTTVFATNANAVTTLRAIRTEGGVSSTALLEPAGIDRAPADWSADGRFLLFRQGRTGAGEIGTVWVLPRANATPAYEWLTDPAGIDYARFSPDGRWVAYRTGLRTSPEVRVAPFPGPGGRLQVARGGDFPRWRGTVVSCTTSTSRTASWPWRSRTSAGRSCSERRGRCSRPGSRLARSTRTDGQRCVVNTLVDEPTATAVTLV